MKALIACGIVALCLIVLGLKQAEPKPLMESARRTGSVVPEGTVSYNEQVQDFFPLSSKELLFVQRITNTQAEPPKIVEDNWVSSIKVFRINLTTGKVKRQAHLEKAISEWFWDFSLSPDGKWLLCKSRDKKRPNRIVNLETGDTKNVPLVDPSSTAWFPSSATLLTTVFPEPPDGWPYAINAPTPYVKAFTFSRVNPRRTQSCTFEYGSENNSKFTAIPYWGAPVLITPDKRLLTLYSYQATAEHPWHQVIRICEFAIRGSRLVLLNRHKIEPPNDSVYNKVVRINAQGTRVLWQSCKRETYPAKSWGFSTSNLDGSDRREYGRVIMRSKNERYAPENVWEEHFGAEWLPDGKTICFIANRSIYTIPDK